jgi:hypothetical protein
MWIFKAFVWYNTCITTCIFNIYNNDEPFQFAIRIPMNFLSKIFCISETIFIRMIIQNKAFVKQGKILLFRKDKTKARSQEEILKLCKSWKNKISNSFINPCSIYYI